MILNEIINLHDLDLQLFELLDAESLTTYPRHREPSTVQAAIPAPLVAEVSPCLDRKATVLSIFFRAHLLLRLARIHARQTARASARSRACLKASGAGEHSPFLRSSSARPVRLPRLRNALLRANPSPARQLNASQSPVPHH